MNPEKLHEVLYENGLAWLRKQPAAYRSVAKRIGRQRTEHLAPFFGDDVHRVRISVANIADPPFYADLLKQGADERDLLHFSKMEAITFDDVIVSQPGVNLSLPLLFHELVHVTQYRLLGLDRFGRTYIDGWFAGRDTYLEAPMQRYREIPHEAVAYDLAGRYGAEPERTFLVERTLQELLPDLFRA